MKKFIVGIRQHPVLGYLAVPLIVGDCQEEYCKIIRTVVFQDIIDSPKEYSQLEKEIVSVIDNYSDEKIYSFYNKSKKLSITDYFSSLEKDFIENHIRPYVEKHITHLLKILSKNKIEIY